MDEEEEVKKKGKIRKAGEKAWTAAKLTAPVVGPQLLAAGKIALNVGVSAAAAAADSGAPGSGMGVQALAGVLEAVVGVGIELGKMVYQAHYNKIQCLRLGEQVEVVLNAVSGMDLLKDISRFMSALERLQDTLIDALAHVKKFSQRGWFKRIVYAHSDDEDFQKYHQRLLDHSADLNLGITAQIKESQEKLAEAAKVDMEEIKLNQQTILDSNMEVKEEIMRQQMTQEETSEVLKKQMESMQMLFESKLKLMEQVLMQSAKPLQAAPPAQPTKSNSGVFGIMGEENLDEKMHIPFCDFEIHEKVHDKSEQGKFGAVYVGKWHEQKVFIKMVIDLYGNQKDIFTREVKINSNLKSPRIQQFYGCCIEPNRGCMVMEYMEGGTLNSFLKEQPKMPFHQRLRLAIEICEGLYYLHSQGIYHRDLWTKSVLLDGEGHAKIGDFGMAKTMQFSIQTLDKSKTSESRWLPPEMTDFRFKYNHKGDVFCLGMVLYELFTGKEPYQGISNMEIINRIRAKRYETFDPLFDKNLAAIITACWIRPDLRPDVSHILHCLRCYRCDEDRFVRGIKTSEEWTEMGLTAENEKNYPKAQAYYERAASMGNIRAQTNLAMLFVRDLIRIKERVADLEDDSLLLPQSNPKSSNTFQFRPPENKKFAYLLLENSAIANHARSMVNLGYMLEKGDGVPQDINKARYWYELGAAQNDATAVQRLQRLQQTFR